MPKLLTLEDAAETLGVPQATLRLWVHKSYGPPSAKIGKRRMFREADIDRWVSEQFETAGGKR